MKEMIYGYLQRSIENDNRETERHLQFVCLSPVLQKTWESAVSP